MGGQSNTRANDIDSIKLLKMNYWRWTDGKLWDKVGECFAQDAAIDYPNGIFRGRQAIANSMKQTLGHGPVAHEGRNLGIEMTGDTSARGTWQASVSMTDAKTGAPLTMRVSYDDEYVKVGDSWLMRASKMRIMRTA